MCPATFKEQIELQKIKQRLELVEKQLKLASVQQRNQRFIQQINDTTPSLIYSYDLIEKRIIYVNRSVTSILGYSKKEIQRMGKSVVRNLLHPDDIELVREHYQKYTTLKDNKVLEIEFRIRDCRGEWLWLRSLYTVFYRTTDGRIRQILGTASDITLRKQKEESQARLIEAKQEEFNRMKSGFISMVCREFRIPLTTIVSSTEVLENLVCNSLEKQQVFNQIKQAASHMNRLVEDMLLIDGYESQKQKVKITRFDALQLISSTAKLMEISQGSKNPILVTTPGKANWVELDKKLLRQILINLLENAIKYSSENHSICLRFIRSPGKAVFQVQDKGIGIPSQDIPHLFECFHRGSNVGRISGKGLGLAIVKQCVDLHKGEITVHSIVGRGTTFTVTLPQKS